MHVSNCYKTQKTCEKAVDTFPFMLHCVLNCYKTQKMCEKSTFKDPLLLKYCLDKYKSQEKCYKAGDACLSPLVFVPNWFVMNKILEKLDVGFSNDDVVFNNADFDNLHF